VLQKSEMDESQFRLFEDAVDIGDFVDVSGTVFKTKSGECSLKVKKWRMLAKSLLPIPAQWYGVKDEETRLRQRYAAAVEVPLTAPDDVGAADTPIDAGEDDWATLERALAWGADNPRSVDLTDRRAA